MLTIRSNQFKGKIGSFKIINQLQKVSLADKVQMAIKMQTKDKQKLDSSLERGFDFKMNLESDIQKSEFNNRKNTDENLTNLS